MPVRFMGIGRPRPVEPGKAGAGAERAPLDLDVWEWEGGSGEPAGEAAPDRRPAAFRERLPLERAGRAGWPRQAWVGFLAFGAGIVAVGLLDRARPR